MAVRVGEESVVDRLEQRRLMRPRIVDFGVDSGLGGAKRWGHDVLCVPACFAARGVAQSGQNGVSGGVDESMGLDETVSFDVVNHNTVDA